MSNESKDFHSLLIARSSLLPLVPRIPYLTLVERRTDHRAVKLEALVKLEVLVACDAAARDERVRIRLAHETDRLRVNAFHRAVAGDVRVDDVLDALLRHAAGEFSRG